jgi:hypothetical protein
LTTKILVFGSIKKNTNFPENLVLIHGEDNHISLLISTVGPALGQTNKKHVTRLKPITGIITILLSSGCHESDK